MKSYTDLKQSKKLAEILPLESADMYYHNRSNIPDNYPLPIEWKHNNPLLSQEIPCWSIVALINIINNDYYTNIFHDGAAWNINIIHHDTGNKHTTYGNSLIDICYKTILKLY